MNTKLSNHKKEENSEITKIEKIANDSSLSENSNFEEIYNNYEDNEKRFESTLEGYKEFIKEIDEEHNEKNIEKEKYKKIFGVEGNFSEIYNSEERKENDIIPEYLSFLEQSQRPKIDIVNSHSLFDIQEPQILSRIQEYESYIESYIDCDSNYESEEDTEDSSPEDENLRNPE